ncbi:unnamed protein product [Rotaria sp. Silwood1]|nr:unnamed protein product [Rotaria sp. Silwood1]
MSYGDDRRSSYPRLTGWVGKLFSYSQSNDMERLKLDNIRVPLSLVNGENRTRKQCFILGGFHGVLSTKDYKHRPVLSLTIIEQVQESKPRPTKLKSK